MTPETASIDETFKSVRDRDLFGHRVHCCAAVLYFMMLPLVTGPKDIAFVILGASALARLWFTRSLYPPVLVERVGWLLALWGAWRLLSLSWSSDVTLGLDELRPLRFLLTAVVLWPVMQAVPWMIGGFLVGVLAQNAVQLGSYFELFGLHPGPHGRLHGALHPIQTATMCTIGACWFLSALIHGGRRLRILSGVGLLAAGAGTAMTGSRGPWIAAAVALPVGLLVIWLRRPERRRRVVMIGGLGIIAAAMLYGARYEFFNTRIQQAITDIRSADDVLPYKTDVGLRLANWQVGWKAFQSAPLRGIGAGGFPLQARQSDYREILKKTHHVHSMYLHELATGGIIGLGLFGLVLMAAFRRAAGDRLDHPFADGTLPALIAWAIAASFDTYELAGQTFAVFVALTVLSLPCRPRAQNCPLS